MEQERNEAIYSIDLPYGRFAWDLDAGTLHVRDHASVLFWPNPSLFYMLAPLCDEVGIPLFRLLIAYHSSVGTSADYTYIIERSEKSFDQAFLQWGRRVASSGWGHFELSAYDAEAHTATVIVHNPWELVMQQSASQNWGCPFLQGKVIGLFSHAFQIPCWAAETVSLEEDQLFVRFDVSPSTISLSDELTLLRQQRQDAEQARLQAEIHRHVAELKQAQAEQVRLQDEALRMQEALIAELSTPLIPIHDRIVLMPLIGQIDGNRAFLVLETLLEGVAKHHADVAILDITGLPIVDTNVANILIQSTRAIRLLGTSVVITGIRPEVAQTLVSLGVDLGGITARGTLQSGIAYALSLIKN